mmetsp:Transcript_9620/g.38924  ORF Transcript_9620/g.38924 Transcript_9620/m.38924 type:complete len:222 (+) Transcript_9620:329-994(+)
MTSPTLAYCLQNLGVTLAWCGCCMKPNRSWYTSTCPLVASPAPMPMVGTLTAAVTAAATVLGTHSTTTAKHPARSSSIALSTTCAAVSKLRPWGLKPPRTEMDCGVSPTWPITAMPESTRAFAVCTRDGEPPSSLTASMPPSFSIRVAASMACADDCSYDPKGRSPTSNGRVAPRDTALQWLSISSRVMGKVVSWPWTTIAAESPTSATSMPAMSTCTALG